MSHPKQVIGLLKNSPDYVACFGPHIPTGDERNIVSYPETERVFQQKLVSHHTACPVRVSIQRQSALNLALRLCGANGIGVDHSAACIAPVTPPGLPDQLARTW